MTFDCKKAFVGEEVYRSIKFKNIGGEGQFFVMSEIDWFSMDIMDILETNTLRLPSFIVQPAYFALKRHQELTFHMYFSPVCYGIHVEQLYILCDNCTLLPTEIIGDGLIYEPNLIRLNKQFEKVQPLERNIDKQAKYYVKLSTNTSDGIEECVISVNNYSEIAIHFHWKKRSVEVNNGETVEENFPLKLVHIKPHQGVFAPNSVHYFTLTAEYKDLQPNYYFTVLELYVEDIPIEAVPEKTKLRTQECFTKQRKCSASVDIWIADVEICLQYMMHEENETHRTTDEMFERIAEMPSYCEYAEENCYKEGEREKKETKRTEEKKEHKFMYQLVADELFSHYDIVNLKQFEPLWREQIISIGIIRPTRTLHIGIEETYVLMLKNLANIPLTYTWGEVNGLDSKKIKLCACPENGEILPGKTKKMEITFLPIEEGIIRSLFIPCLVGDARKMIILAVECSIQPLYVTFYFPLDAKEATLLRNNFTRVEWRVDSLKLAFDMTGKLKKHMEILDKYRMREERELMSTNLDQGSILKNTSAGTSMQKVVAEESGEQSSLSTRTSEIIQMSNLTVENENYSQDLVLSGNIVPFREKFLPFPTQPVVIEFLNLSLRTVAKKTFIIKNETSIPTNFWLHIKNYYPIVCSCERKYQKDRIKSVYKRIFGNQKHLIEEKFYKVKQPKSGVVIYLDPLNSNIGPFSAISVDIFVFADTWGIYVDELEINVTGLPQCTIGICIQVVGSPISLSISDRNEFNIPIIKYGIEPIGVHLQDRKILLKNTSIVPIAIDWYSFLVKPLIETMPFNVLFNLFTPFTDKLASELRASMQKNDSEVHLEEHKHFPISKSLHTNDSSEINNISDATRCCT
ncbi:uncharacterized protein LOC143428732 [Xylocopa sonorina]|uniref:uncharacterized protein LOC143428732 n=1 Tax=Xylocopa sonorina TaxID=1818115 RepID=UPI00403AE434